jgi:hypothetical protein
MAQMGHTIFTSPSKVGGPACLVLLSEMRDKTTIAQAIWMADCRVGRQEIKGAKCGA